MLITLLYVHVFFGFFLFFFFPKEVEQSAAELGAGFSLANNNYSAALVMSHPTHNATLNQWSMAGRFQQLPSTLYASPASKIHFLDSDTA